MTSKQRDNLEGLFGDIEALNGSRHPAFFFIGPYARAALIALRESEARLQVAVEQYLRCPFDIGPEINGLKNELRNALTENGGDS